MDNMNSQVMHRVCATLDSRWLITSVQYNLENLRDHTTSWVNKIIEISEDEMSQLKDQNWDYTSVFWNLNTRIT